MIKSNCKYVWLCILLIISICLTLTGCRVPQPTTSSVASSVVVDDISSDMDIELPVSNLNPLTGLYDLEEGEASRRPVAVMINNIKKARPQSGICSADIIYEMEVEGGITRLLAVFANSGRIPEKLGSVRSMRPYYINLAAGHDAIFVGNGWSPTAKNLLKQGINDYVNPNGRSSDGAAFYRDADKAKAKGREHSSYTTREKLEAVISSLKLRTELEDDRVGQSFMKFNPPDEAKAVGMDCLSLYVPFSSYAKSTFTYDAQKKLYLKEEFSDKHIDEATGEQLAFTNVLVLFMPSGKEDVKRLTFDFSSPGSGYYASMGKLQKITWEKGKEFKNPFIFKDAKGQPLTANAGKTMVCIVRETRSKDISYE